MSNEVGTTNVRAGAQSVTPVPSPWREAPQSAAQRAAGQFVARQARPVLGAGAA
jgi:hypothetical protein